MLFLLTIFLFTKQVFLFQNFFIPHFIKTFPPFWYTSIYAHIWNAFPIIKKVEGKESMHMPLTCQMDVRNLFWNGPTPDKL